MECTYCGCAVEAHNPVAVEQREGGRTKEFCNYGCLAAHIEAEELANGTVCELSAA
jgi:Lon protease-like protein